MALVSICLVFQLRMSLLLIKTPKHFLFWGCLCFTGSLGFIFSSNHQYPPCLGSNRFFTLSYFSSVEFILTSCFSRFFLHCLFLLLFLLSSLRWRRARHMLTISLMDSIGPMIGYDITSNCRCARPFVSKLWQPPCLWSFIFLLPSSKPLQTALELNSHH